MMIKYSVAPYNFVSFPEKSGAAYKSMEELPCHNVYSNELLNGVITYEIEAKSPVIVSKGNDKNSNNRNDFFVNPEGKLTIPGNTIRGLTRTKAAILSMSNITNDIEDSLFMYRSVADKSSCLRKAYNERLGIKTEKRNNKTYTVVNNVKAGYIYQKYKDAYYIVPAKETKEGRTYYTIKENDLYSIAKDIEGINYMYNHQSQKNNKLEQNSSYKPYMKKIKYKLKSLKDVCEIKEIMTTDEESLQNGYILSSNYMFKKQAHYIIREIDNFDKEEKVEDKFIHSYKEDLDRDKIEDKYYFLPDEDEIGEEYAKPVFYMKYNGKLYFGFTPYLRIFYDHSIRDGIKDSYKSSDGISFCDAVFGFTKDDINNKKFNKNYKSRVSFCDATSEDNPAKYNEKENGVKLIPGGPKATCIQCYLKQDENDIEKIKSYNDCNFSIRGIKNYWIKDETDPDVSKNNENVNITIYPAHKGVKFIGRIKFDNLKKEELGLLLWSLKISENAHDNIGMAKEYGFGNVEFENINLEIEDLNKKYKSINGFFSYMDKKDIKEYINYYKKFFKDKFKVDIDNEKSVKELLMMKTNFIRKEDENNFRHMSIEKKEFRNRYPLPDVEDIIAKKCYKLIETNQPFKEVPDNTAKKQCNDNNIESNKKNSNIKNKTEEDQFLKNEELKAKKELVKQELAKEEESKLQNMTESQKVVYYLEKNKFDEGYINEVISKLSSFSDQDKINIAKMLKENYSKEGKWNGKCSNKVKKKIESLKAILKEN